MIDEEVLTEYWVKSRGWEDLELKDCLLEERKEIAKILAKAGVPTGEESWKYLKFFVKVHRGKAGGQEKEKQAQTPKVHPIATEFCSEYLLKQIVPCVLEARQICFGEDSIPFSTVLEAINWFKELESEQQVSLGEQFITMAFATGFSDFDIMKYFLTGERPTIMPPLTGVGKKDYTLPNGIIINRPYITIMFFSVPTSEDFKQVRREISNAFNKTTDIREIIKPEHLQLYNEAEAGGGPSNWPKGEKVQRWRRLARKFGHNDYEWAYQTWKRTGEKKREWVSKQYQIKGETQPVKPAKPSKSWEVFRDFFEGKEAQVLSGQKPT